MKKINITGLVRDYYAEIVFLKQKRFTTYGAFMTVCESNNIYCEASNAVVNKAFCLVKKELGNVAPKAVALSKLTEGKGTIQQESIHKSVVAVAQPVQQDRSNNITNTTPKTRPPIGTMIHKQESRKKAIDLTEADEGLQKHINNELKNMKKESNND